MAWRVLAARHRRSRILEVACQRGPERSVVEVLAENLARCGGEADSQDPQHEPGHERAQRVRCLSLLSGWRILLRAPHTEPPEQTFVPQSGHSRTLQKEV